MRAPPHAQSAAAGGPAASSAAGPRDGGFGASFSSADNLEAFRAGTTRAAEKQRDGARYRASLARLTRERVHVPERESSLLNVKNITGPVAIAALWAAIYFVFIVPAGA